MAQGEFAVVKGAVERAGIAIDAEDGGGGVIAILMDRSGARPFSPLPLAISWISHTPSIRGGAAGAIPSMPTRLPSAGRAWNG